MSSVGAGTGDAAGTSFVRVSSQDAYGSKRGINM